MCTFSTPNCAKTESNRRNTFGRGIARSSETVTIFSSFASSLVLKISIKTLLSSFTSESYERILPVAKRSFKIVALNSSPLFVFFKTWRRCSNRSSDWRKRTKTVEDSFSNNSNFVNAMRFLFSTRTKGLLLLLRLFCGTKTELVCDFVCVVVIVAEDNDEDALDIPFCAG